MNKLKPSVLRFFIYLLCLLLVFVVIGAMVGESPFKIMQFLLLGGFASNYDFGRSLYYATPLIFTGLAVALPLKAGLFNIGAEGQLYVGAFCGFYVAQLFPGLPAPIAVALGAVSCFLAGALWAGIAGWVRAYRGGHEVIATIMLNYIAVALTTFFTLQYFRTSENQNPETFQVPSAFKLMPWSWADGAPVSSALVLAILLCIGLFIWEKKSIRGFRLNAVGENPNAAAVNRISVKSIYFLTMACGGGIAGLVGFSEVLGSSHRFQVGFSLDYGFMGIAVALLARKNFLMIVPAALLLGAMYQGATILQFNADKVIPEIVLVLQAILILMVTLWNSTQKSSTR